MSLAPNNNLRLRSDYPGDTTLPTEADKMLDWLQDRAEEGCVTLCFEMDGGMHVTLDPCGGEQRAARYVNSIRQGIAQLMMPTAEKPAYGPDNPPRLRKPDESVEEYRAAMGWGTKTPNAGGNAT